MKTPVTILAAVLLCNAAIAHEHDSTNWETVWECDGLTLYGGKIDPDTGFGPGYIDLHGLSKYRAAFAMAGFVPGWIWPSDETDDETFHSVAMENTAAGWQAYYFSNVGPDSLKLLFGIPEMTFYNCTPKR